MSYHIYYWSKHFNRTHDSNTNFKPIYNFTLYLMNVSSLRKDYSLLYSLSTSIFKYQFLKSRAQRKRLVIHNRGCFIVLYCTKTADWFGLPKDLSILIILCGIVNSVNTLLINPLAFAPSSFIARNFYEL